MRAVSFAVWSTYRGQRTHDSLTNGRPVTNVSLARAGIMIPAARATEKAKQQQGAGMDRSRRWGLARAHLKGLD
jgi:hypothetical protein